MRHFTTLLVLLAVLLVATINRTAQASILGANLSFDGIEDRLEDDSRAAFLDNDLSGDYSVGDTIYGFVSVSDTSSGDPSPDEIAILFAFDVAGTATSQDGTVYFTHSAPSAGLASLLDPAFAPIVSIATDGSATTADATFVIVANTGSRNPLNPTEIVNGGDLTGFTVADGWVYQATGGIDPGGMDFLHLEASGAARSEFGGLTVFDHVLGSSVVFVPVTVDRFAEEDFVAPFPTTSDHDIAIEGAVTAHFLAPSSGGWVFSDSSDMRLNATPEPASLAVWCGLGAVALLFRRKRRRLS